MSNENHVDDAVPELPDSSGVSEGPTPTAPPTPTRLQRSRDRRVLAGVAGGISERFDVNENLVRAVFVVLTVFWGLGAAIYLVMWVIVRRAPVEGGREQDEERAPVSTSHRLTMAIVAAVVVLAVVVVAIARPVRILGPSVALAWIVFLVALAIIAIRTPARRITFRRVVGLAFLVAVSVVIVFVGAVMAFLSSTGVSLAGGMGDRVWQPTSLAQVHRAYPTEFGTAKLDLSAVTFPVTGYALSASVAAGVLEIVVPTDAVVSLTTNVGAGRVSTTVGGVPGVATVPFTSQPPGVSSVQSLTKPHLTIDARVGAGQIDLMRALSSRS